MVTHGETVSELELKMERLKSRIVSLEKNYTAQIDEMFAIMDGVEGAVYVSDMRTYEVLRVNKYVKTYYGDDAVGKKCYEVFQNERNRPCSFCTNDRLLVKGKPAHPVIWDFQNIRTMRWYQCIDKAIHWPDGRFVRMEIAIDITERKKAEIALRESESFLNTIFDSINDPFNIIDRNYRIIKANESYAQMRGKTVEQLTGCLCYEVLQNRKSICEGCLVKGTFDSGYPNSKEKLLRVNGDSQVWIEIYTYPVFDEKGTVKSVIEYTRDITERKRTEIERAMLVNRLKHLYQTDDLTGLLNRRALIDRLEKEIQRAKRYGSQLSLVICDIDYFKEINDRYGHDVGDRVLQKVSSLMQETLRNSDMIGRYGGDEFFLILPETSILGAQQIAERVRFIIHKHKFKIGRHKPIKTTLSLGIVEFQKNHEDITGFIRRADNALYMAKGKGRNRVYFINDGSWTI